MKNMNLNMITKESLNEIINEEIYKTENLISSCVNTVDKNYYIGMLRGYENILNYINF